MNSKLFCHLGLEDDRPLSGYYLTNTIQKTKCASALIDERPIYLSDAGASFDDFQSLASTIN